MASRWLIVAAMAAVAAAECANGCSGHGECGANDQCICYDGFVGGDCSLRVCPMASAFVDTPRGDLNHDGKVGYTAKLANSATTAEKAALGYSKVQWSRYLQYEAWPTLAKDALTSPDYVNKDANGNIYVPSSNPADSSVVGGWQAQPGEAHFVAECSGKGSCDRSSGACRCFEGFTGAACQRTTCPNDCSGHGVCRTVSEIALAGSGKKFVESLAGTNVYAGMAQPYDYRLWDGEQGTSCVCDPFYGGIDCSLRMCPMGDDPLTTIDQTCGGKDCEDEVQAFSVDGNQDKDAPGQYRLLFTDYNGVVYKTDEFELITKGASAAIDDDTKAANEAAVKKALESLPNNVTGVVEVNSVSPFFGGAAAKDQVRLAVTFTTKSGNVPDMRLIKSVADSATRSAYIFQPGQPVWSFTINGDNASPEAGKFTIKLFPQDTSKYGSEDYWISPEQVDANGFTAAEVVTAAVAALNGIPAIEVEDSTRGYFRADSNVYATTTANVHTVYVAMPNKQFGANKIEICVDDCPTDGPVVATSLKDVIDGNKEHVTCSNRGICDFGSGLCKCFTGYTGAACETQSTLAM